MPQPPKSAPKPAQIGQDEAQERLKSAQESQQRPQSAKSTQHQSTSILGPSWVSLGALLEPSWRLLRPTRRPKGSPRGFFWRVPWELFGRCLGSAARTQRCLGKRKSYFTIFAKRVPWGGRRFRSDPTVFFKDSVLPRHPFKKNLS